MTSPVSTPVPVPVSAALVSVFTCDCKPGFNWKTKATYKAHFTSQRHLQNETRKQELEHRKAVTRLQIEVNRLRLENIKLRRLYLKLLLTKEQEDPLQI